MNLRDGRSTLGRRPKGRHGIAGPGRRETGGPQPMTFAAMFHPVSYHFYFYILAGLAVAVRELAHGSQPTVEPVLDSSGAPHGNPRWPASLALRVHQPPQT